MMMSYKVTVNISSGEIVEVVPIHSPSPVARRTIHVGKIHKLVTKNQLVDFFQKTCGPVQRAMLFDRRFRNFALLEFEDEQTAGIALRFDEYQMEGGRISVRHAKENTAMQKYFPESKEILAKIARTVFVSNVQHDVTVEVLKDYFTRACGDVLRIKEMRRDYKREGAAMLVEFRTPNDASNALRCNGTVPIQDATPISVTKSDTWIY